MLHLALFTNAAELTLRRIRTSKHTDTASLSLTLRSALQHPPPGRSLTAGRLTPLPRALRPSACAQAHRDHHAVHRCAERLRLAAAEPRRALAAEERQEEGHGGARRAGEPRAPPHLRRTSPPSPPPDHLRCPQASAMKRQNSDRFIPSRGSSGSLEVAKVRHHA